MHRNLWTARTVVARRAVACVGFLWLLGAPSAASAAEARPVWVGVQGAGTVVLSLRAEAPDGTTQELDQAGRTCGDADRRPPLDNAMHRTYPTVGCTPFGLGPPSDAPFACPVPAGQAMPASTCTLIGTAHAQTPGPAAVGEEAASQRWWTFAGWAGNPGCTPTPEQPALCTFKVAECSDGGATCTYDAGLSLTAAFRDNHIPTASFVSRPPAPPAYVATPDGHAAFTFKSDEYTTGERSRFQCSLDRPDAWLSCSSTPGDPDAEIPFEVFGLDDGEHALYVRAVDASGQRHVGGIVTEWVQRYPPTTLVTSGPANGAVVDSTRARFDFAAVIRRPSRAVEATFQCALDSTIFTACTAPASFDQEVSQGEHVLRVRATRQDVEPPLSQTGATEVRWTVDTVPPSTVIDAGPAEGLSTADRDATFKFHATEAAAGFECSLDGASPVACNGGEARYVGLARGAHTFTVSAIDPAGNREQPAQQRSWTVLADEDGDGHFEADCDDSSAFVHPAAVEIPGDGRDQNCNGTADADDDGYVGAADCDDASLAVHPGADEVPENGRDDDCRGGDAFFDAIGVAFRARSAVHKRFVRVLALVVRNAPAGSRVVVRCKGRGCRAERRSMKVPKARSQLRVERLLGRKRNLGRGAVVRVRVTKPGTSGQVRIFKVTRKGLTPDSDACIRGGVVVKGACS